MTGEGPQDGRISLDLRVGVTGHRWIDAEDPAFRTVVRAGLDQLRAACTNASTPSTPVGLTIVSSLAEGADRLVAEVGLETGAHLEVVLPLTADDYCADFKDDRSRRDFEELLARATSVTTVPGNPARPDAYAVAGSLVVRRADAMFALWDGLPSRGRGGTAEIVDATGAMEKPLVWIEVPAPGRHGEPVLREVPATVSALSAKAFRSLDRYNRQRVRVDVRGSHEGFPRFGDTAAFLLPYYLRADTVAGRWQHLFRRASVTLYVLSVLAIVAPAVQLVYYGGEQRALTISELAALLIIIAILMLGRRTLLLERWLTARLLAERLRSIAFLISLSADGSPSTIATDGSDVTPFDEWRARALDELSIRAPRPRTDAGVLLRTAAATLTDEWVRPQIAYHAKVSAGARRRHRQFKAAAVALFGLSVVAAAIHLSDLHPTKYADAVFVALVVPTLAAALSGYSAQRDYPRIDLQSRAMVRSLTNAVDEVSRMTSIADLRLAAQRIDFIMRGESVDWYAAVRLREPEVP